MGWKWPIPKEGWGRWNYLLIAIMAGIVLLCVPNGPEKSQLSEQAGQQEFRFDLDEEERRLERALEQVWGVGEVTVVLTLKESGRQILARDTRQSDREQNTAAVVLSRGNGMEEPVILNRFSPTYQGALVVCDGGGDARVKLQVLEAVRALTGLSGEKISICKRQ